MNNSRILEATVDAIGESDNDIGGLNQTRLSAVAEPTTPLGAPFTWDGTSVVLTPSTAGISTNDYVRLESDKRAFKVLSVVPNTSVTVDPAGVTPPTGPDSAALAQTYTWDSTVVVACADTSELAIGLWIRLDADGQWFEVNSIDPDVSVTIVNPLSLTIPTGAGGSSWSVEPRTVKVTTSVAVETVLDWPDAGKVAIDGEAYSYTVKTAYPPSLDGLAYAFNGEAIVGLRHAHREQAVVTDVTLSRSALERVRLAMLVRYASAEDLNVVGRNLGVLRPTFLGDDDVFRAVIAAVAYCPKGTIYAMELVLTALVGAGNFEIYEDLISHPCIVFIRLSGAAALSLLKEGKAYLTGPEILIPDDEATITLDHAPVAQGCVRSVTLKNEDHLSDFRQQKPSVETIVEYPGDAGTQVWLFDGVSESNEVALLADGEGVSIGDNRGATASRYYHVGRVRPESYASLQTVMMIPSTTSLNASGVVVHQWSAWILDGAQQVGWGVDGIDASTYAIGLTTNNEFALGSIVIDLDTYYDVELRKYGQDRVELWIDGVLRQRLTYSYFVAATSGMGFWFGASDAMDDSVVGRVRQAGIFSRTVTDYNAARGTCSVNSANVTADTGDFVASDVGKQITIQGSAGHGDGTYEVATFGGASLVGVRGALQSEALTAAADGVVTRVRVGAQAQQYVYPDDIGKQLQIIGSDQGNTGLYTIDKILDPDTLVDLADYDTLVHQKSDTCELLTASLVAETGLTYRVNPDFDAEVDLTWELSAAGSLAATELTLRQAMPVLSMPGIGAEVDRVLEVTYTQVLTAQLLLDLSVRNLMTQEVPDLLFSHYPFYLSDPFAFIRYFMGDITAAGVIAEYIAVTE